MTGHVRINHTVIERHLAAIGPSAAVVLLAIAKHADRRGRCHPSISTICRLTGCCKAVVHRSLKTLRQRGLLTVESRRDEAGDRTTNRYTIHVGGGSENELPSSESELGVVQKMNQGSSENEQRTNTNELTPIEQKDRKRPNFVKPTLGELREYIAAKAFSVNPEAFLAHYESNGWRVGRNPMKCWRSAVTTWHENRHRYSKSTAVPNCSASRPMKPPRESRKVVTHHA